MQTRIKSIGDKPVVYNDKGRIARIGKEPVQYNFMGDLIIRVGDKVVTHLEGGKLHSIGNDRVAYHTDGKISFVGNCMVIYSEMTDSEENKTDRAEQTQYTNSQPRESLITQALSNMWAALWNNKQGSLQFVQLRKVEGMENRGEGNNNRQCRSSSA